MDERKALAWLGRKIGWGLHPDQLDRWSDLGVSTVVDQLVNPDDYGIAKRKDRFRNVNLDDKPSRLRRYAGQNWVESAVMSPRPLETFMEFFWSDFFAVSFRVIRPRRTMIPHMNKLARHSLGNFSEMLATVSRDAAMLDFLDNGRNTAANPNENYARELLELYTVGVGHFSETDVKAASRALTGWHVSRRTGEVEFRRENHDKAKQEILGVEGVGNVVKTIDAALAHPATAPRIVDKLALAILGPGYSTELTDSLVQNFASTMELKPVVHGLLELAVQGHAQPAILEPLAWYVNARRLPTRNPHTGRLREYFQQSGQIPLNPPNVGGFPDPEMYLSTSATIARFNMATHLADRSTRSRQLAVVIGSVEQLTEDLDALATRIGLLDGFAPATLNALDGVAPGVDRLAATLASPDVLVV